MRLPGFLLVCLMCNAVQAAPATDRIAAYRALVDQDLRLAITGYRLASANAAFCAQRERNPGWILHDEQQYPDRQTARAAFGFRHPVAVSAVVPGGPADVAGIKPGDALIAIGNQTVNVDKHQANETSAKRVEAVGDALKNALKSSGPVAVTLDTANGRSTFDLDPPLICASRFWVDARAKLDAGADGDGVRITTGLMAFTAHDDAELAAVVAHELAHNLLLHRQRLNAVNRRTADILATEIEADRLSVWLMANAGFDTEAALRFAERYGRKTGLGILSDGTHLRWKNRVKLMRAEIDIIRTAPQINGKRPPPLLVVE